MALVFLADNFFVTTPGDTGTSKDRWSVSNMGAEQDEGITSTRDKRPGVSHTPKQ